jgi:hypothetical protein
MESDTLEAFYDDFIKMFNVSWILCILLTMNAGCLSGDRESKVDTS